MSEIQLDITAISKVQLERYGSKFSFIVNGEEYQTSQLISDLLSPTIRAIHLNDPTFDEIKINTNHPGNFSNILKLVNFNRNKIDEQEMPFIIEILDILGSDQINIQDINQTYDINVNNILSLLKKHSKYSMIYFKRHLKEIEFAASHFYEILAEQREELSTIDIEILNEILSNEHLRIKSEDQLVKFINDLYSKDVKYSKLYDNVNFVNVTSEMMKEFIDLFDMNDISNQIWIQLSSRLIEELSTKKKTNNNERYDTTEKDEKNERLTSMTFEMKNDQTFDGIINYLKKQSGNNIENEIDFSSSSYSFISYKPINVSKFEDKYSYFLSKDEPNSWICFYFKNHQVIPTHYTIRTFGIDSNPHPKSWVIESSNDKISWDNLDTQNESPYLQKGWIVHTFNINKSNSKSYKYIRMRLTDKTTQDDNRLLIDSFEIYGTLI